jgi:hypothetical protein
LRAGGKVAGRRAHSRIRHTRAVLVVLICLLRPASACDWTCEPPVAFDGVDSRVTTSLGAAPTGWSLHGGAFHVTRTFDSCLDQTLTIVRKIGGVSSSDSDSGGDRGGDHACEDKRDEQRASAGGKPPDAVVLVDGEATALGGDFLAARGRRMWRLAAGAVGDAAAINGSVSIFTLRCGPEGEHATAVVTRHQRTVQLPGRWQEEVTTKRIRILNDCASSRWVHVAVNIRS